MAAMLLNKSSSLPTIRVSKICSFRDLYGKTDNSDTKLRCCEGHPECQITGSLGPASCRQEQEPGDDAGEPLAAASMLSSPPAYQQMEAGCPRGTTSRRRECSILSPLLSSMLAAVSQALRFNSLK